MKKKLFLMFVIVAGFTATFLTSCGKDEAKVYSSTNYVGTYHGYFSLVSLAISTDALDSVIGKQLYDTLTIVENGNNDDNIVTAQSKALGTSIDITLTSETAGDIAINNKSVTIDIVEATGVSASGTTNYNTTTKTLSLSATATAGKVFNLDILGIAKPVLSGTFIKQ